MKRVGRDMQMLFMVHIRHTYGFQSLDIRKPPNHANV